MRRILRVLLVAGLVIAAAWWLALIPGTVTAQLGGLTVETSAPAAGLGLVVLFALVYLLVRLVAWIVSLPRRGRGVISRRARRQGERAVTRALLALAAGEGSDARREAARARRLLGDSAQTLLLVAQAGRVAGREDEAETAFHALARREDAAFLGYRGLLRQAIARQDWAEAATLARQAERAHPGAAWLRAERSQLAIRTGNWAEALALAGPDAPRAAFAVAAADAEPDAPRALRLAREAFEADPRLAPAALAYARRLRAEGREARAMKIIQKAWREAPHPDLADFAFAAVGPGLERVRAAQELVRDNPTHPESRLLLARTALAADLTGEARRQAEAARDAGLDERRLWLLLADIEEAERGDTEAGRLAQRAALRRAAAADDPAWRCGACGGVQPAWAPVCPQCGTAGRIFWGEANTAALPPGMAAPVAALPGTS